MNHNQKCTPYVREKPFPSIPKSCIFLITENDFFCRFDCRKNSQSFIVRKLIFLTEEASMCTLEYFDLVTTCELLIMGSRVRSPALPQILNMD